MTDLTPGASPNNPRYYYPASRAHHAYCMAVDFGMEFEMRSGKWSLDGLKNIDPESSYRIYIHPDSLHLLAPNKDDLMRSSGGSLFQFGSGLETYDGFHGDDEPLIIQRNGIAFMWPESEVV